MPEYFGLLIIIILSATVMGVMFIIQLFYEYSKRYKDDDETTNG